MRMSASVGTWSVLGKHQPVLLPTIVRSASRLAPRMGKVLGGVSVRMRKRRAGKCIVIVKFDREFSHSDGAMQFG